MQIALPAVRRYEILSRVLGYEVVFVGAERRAYTSDNGMLRLNADATLEEVPSPDIVLVPGGFGVFPETEDPIVPGSSRLIRRRPGPPELVRAVLTQADPSSTAAPSA